MLVGLVGERKGLSGAGVTACSGTAVFSSCAANPAAAKEPSEIAMNTTTDRILEDLCSFGLTLKITDLDPGYPLALLVARWARAF
jgi:hypothetical protein